MLTLSPWEGFRLFPIRSYALSPLRRASIDINLSQTIKSNLPGLITISTRVDDLDWGLSVTTIQAFRLSVSADVAGEVFAARATSRMVV